MPAVLRTKSTMDIADDPSAQSWTREYEPLVDDYRYPNYEDSEDTDTEEDEWDLEDSPNRGQVLQGAATCCTDGFNCNNWCSGIGHNTKMLDTIFWCFLGLGAALLVFNYLIVKHTGLYYISYISIFVAICIGVYTCTQNGGCSALTSCAGPPAS